MKDRAARRAVFAALFSSLAADAYGAGSATLTPDRLSYLVNRDLAGQRWTISLNLASDAGFVPLNVTGNVFHGEDAAPTFVLCQLRPDSIGSLDDPASEFRLSCRGADACATTASKCARDGWDAISDDVRIPASFFLPAVAAGTATPPPAGSALEVRVAGAQDTARGATLSYDGFDYLVNKDLAGERWSIALHQLPVPSDAGGFRSEIHSLTGNVFKPDGSAPSFVFCLPRPDSTGTLDDPSSTFRFTCQGAAPCEGNATDCAANGWTPLGDDVAVPASFFLPPGGLPATPRSDAGIVVIGRPAGPPALVASDFTLGDGAATAAGACAVDEVCFVRVGSCESLQGRVVLQAGDTCGCQIDEVPATCITCGEAATGTCGDDCAFDVGASGAVARGICLPFAGQNAACACHATGAASPIAVASCGGAIAATCPDAGCCVDDPRDGCDASTGTGTACSGVCLPGGTCAPGDCIDASGTFAGMIAGKTSCQSSLGPSEHDLSGSMTLTIFQTGCNLVAQQSGPPDYTSFGTRAVATGTIHGNEIELSSGIGKRTDPMNGSCILTGPMDTLVGTLAGDRLDLADASIFENSCVYPISASIIRCTRDARVTASR